MGPLDIRSFFSKSKVPDAAQAKINMTSAKAGESNKENSYTVVDEIGEKPPRNDAQLDADIEAEVRILTAPSLIKPMSTSASVEPILPQAATNPTGQGAEVTACAAATSGDKQSSRQDESKAGSALDQAVHGTNGDQKAKENDHVHGMRSGDGHSGALQTSSKTASLGAAADRNPADPAAPTSAPAPLANASTLAATRALSGDRKDLLLQLQSDVVKIEEALSREILLSQFFWSKQQNNDAPPSCPQPSDGSSEGQVNQTPLFFINDTPSLAAFIEGQSCTLTALVDKVLKVAAPPPSASGIVSSQPQQLDPTAVKAMVVELASRKNDYSLAKGSSDLLSASEDVTDGVLWFWELRDLKKALHTSLSADSHPAPHTSGHIPAPSSLFIPPMAAKDAAKAKKMTDLIRKRRKDLSVLLLSINESISLLSQSTLPTTKSHESKLMKSFTKLYKSSSLDEIEEGMRKGLEELGGKYQAQAQAIQRKLEEKEAKKSEKEAKKIEKVEEKKISKTGFGDKKSLDSARRVMTQFFGKTPVGKGPVAALAFTPAGGGALLSPECQVMPPPPPPGLGSASAARSSLKGSRAGPSFHTPQEIENMRQEMDDLLSRHQSAQVPTQVHTLFTDSLTEWKSKRHQWTRRIKFVPPTWARKAQAMMDPAQHIIKKYGEGAVDVEGDVSNLKSWRRKFIQLSHFDFSSGIHYEANRPPYYGSYSGQTHVIRARKPLNKDMCLFDYDVDSDEEWEDEPEGEDLAGEEEDEEMDAGGGQGEGSVASQDPSGGFMVEDGYLSADEGVVEEEGDVPQGKKKGMVEGQSIDPRLVQIKHACDRAAKGNRCLVALGPSSHLIVHTGPTLIDPRALEALVPIFFTQPHAIKTPNAHCKPLNRVEEYGIYASLAPPSPPKAAAPPIALAPMLPSGLASSSVPGATEGANKGSGGARSKPFPSELVISLREFVSGVKTKAKLSTLVDNFFAAHHSSVNAKTKLTKKSIEDAIKFHSNYSAKSGLWTLKPMDQIQAPPPPPPPPAPSAPSAPAPAPSASLRESSLPPGLPLTVTKPHGAGSDVQGSGVRQEDSAMGRRQLFSTPGPVPLPPPPTPASQFNAEAGSHQSNLAAAVVAVAQASAYPTATPLLLGAAKRMREDDDQDGIRAKKPCL